MAVPCDETVSTPGTGPGPVDRLVTGLPPVFERRSHGDGTKDERYLDRALTEVASPSGTKTARRGWQHLLLARRSISDPTDLAAAPSPPSGRSTDPPAQPQRHAKAPPAITRNKQGEPTT
jgi:hypothetical protein